MSAENERAKRPWVCLANPAFDRIGGLNNRYLILLLGITLNANDFPALAYKSQVLKKHVTFKVFFIIILTTTLSKSVSIIRVPIQHGHRVNHRQILFFRIRLVEWKIP